jgi:hypothetical protein
VKRKKPSGKSPTQRSLKKLRDDGWLAEVVEHWNPFARIRKDLFGFIDIIAIRGNETLAVQSTTRSNMWARISKIKSLQAHELWKSESRKIIVHGWQKIGPTKYQPHRKKQHVCYESQI